MFSIALYEASCNTLAFLDKDSSADRSTIEISAAILVTMHICLLIPGLFGFEAVYVRYGVRWDILPRISHMDDEETYTQSTPKC